MRLQLIILCCLLNVLALGQCEPSPEVMALGDPEGDGVLNPWALEVYPGETINETVTVLAPPDGHGTVVGVDVPYTMNFFTVKRLENKPSWVNYECPDDCKFIVDNYSCVLVTGTVPLDVPIGDSTVMDVIVDANVDAVVLFIPYNGYEVEDENGGQLTIRYVSDPTGVENAISHAKIIYNEANRNLWVDNLPTEHTITVYNASGSKVADNQGSNVVDLSGQPFGIYFVMVIADGNKISRRIVIK